MSKTITIPTELKDISMDSLIRFTKLNGSDEEIQMYQAFWLFCEMDKDLVKALTWKDANEIYGKIGQALSHKPELVQRFEMDGVEYGMIPNLEEMSFGEFIDLDSYITPSFEGEILHEEAFRFMATLYRPIKEEVKGIYSIEDYNPDKNNWRVFKEHCTADVYLGAIGFFLTLRVELLKALKRYLAQESTRITEADKQSLTSIGDGMEALTHLLKEMSLNITQLPNWDYEKPLPNLHLISSQENWQTTKEEIKEDE